MKVDRVAVGKTYVIQFSNLKLLFLFYFGLFFLPQEEKRALLFGI